MSLHLNRQCQRADAHPPPVRLVPGIGYTDQEEARNERETPRGGRVRLLEAHICVTPRCVNRLFADLAASRRWRRPECRNGSRTLIRDKLPTGNFKVQALDFRWFSMRIKRSGYRPASPPLRPRSCPSGASQGRRSKRCRAARRARPRANGGSAAGSSARAPQAPPFGNPP